MRVKDMEHYSLEKKAEDGIRGIGWAELTPIQKKALPVILRERNALLVAPTGSGKTEATVIPIFAKLSQEKAVGKGIRMLYITPLRALNRDIFRRIVRYAEAEGLTARVRHGDTPQAIRRRMVEEPPDVLITTPETLCILLTSKRFRNHFKTLRWIVVDELHELIGNERGTHLSLSLERVEGSSAEKVTRVGLSATLGNLDVAVKFLVGTERKCAVLVDRSIRGYEMEGRRVEGSLYDVADFILNYLREKKVRAALLFTNTRDEAELLGAILSAKGPELPVEVHHGSLSREVREEAEMRLKSGEAGVVVCTSSLELGLDIGAVDLVIQLGSPRQAVKLVQRVGRSRHRVGEVAVGLVVGNRYDDELESLALMRRVKERRLEESGIHEGALDVLAHHLVGLAIEKGYFMAKDALEAFRRAYPFRHLSIEDMDSCLQLLDEQGIIRYDGRRVMRRSRTYEYYYENLSTIPDVQQFEVVDISSNKAIGRLDHLFVGEYGEVGRVFVLKGSSWRIVSVNDDRWEMHVEPVSKDLTTIPYWTGETIPVDFYTAKEVGRIRREVVAGALKVGEKQRERLLKSREVLGCLPDEKTIVIEKRRDGNTLVLHACLGTKVNQTIASLLATLISSKIGYPVEVRSDPYRILLSSVGRLEVNDVVNTFFDEFQADEVLSVALKGTHPLNWKTWNVAKKFGVIGREGQYDRRASRLLQERYTDTPLYREVLRELFLEKYDLQTTREVLSAIREGRRKIVKREVEKFSPLAKPILEHAPGFAALPPSVERSILGLVRGRLEKARHRLVCINCGWERILRTEEAGDAIVCPRCKSRWITSTYPSDEEINKIIKKRIRGKKLTKEEEGRFRKAWKVSSLIQSFGKRAIFALSGFGVGPDTAGRILRSAGDQDDLIKRVYVAEKTFVRTRGFWDEG